MATSKTAAESRAARLRKRHMTPFEDWEAIDQKGVYVRCPSDLLHHPAFLDLTPAARMTLIYMREEAAGFEEFRFPFSTFDGLISKDGFQKSLKQLVDHGFVEVTAQNKHRKICNVYHFSAAWRNWEPPA